MTVRVLFVTVASSWVVLAGCDDPGVRSTAGSRGVLTTDSSQVVPRKTQRAQAGATVFVWDDVSQNTVAFDAAGKRVATIPSYGELATDREADLYIADTDERNVIRIYKPPYTGNPKLLFMPKGRSVNTVAVDQRTDVIAAITSTAQRQGGEGGVEFYRHGETKPCRTVQPQQGIVFSLSGGFDAEGTLFASASTDTVDGIVVSVSGECANGEVQQNTFSGNVLAYDFVGVDADNHIAIQNFAGGNDSPVEIFDHPHNGVFGQPLETVTFQKNLGKDPYAGCLSADGKIWVFFDNYINTGPRGSAVHAYAYPQGGSPLQAIGSIARSQGVTVYPAAIPTNER